MTRVLAVNAKNDLFIGADGSLATAAGLDAVMQACQQAAQTQLGEMIYSTEEGVPNFDAVWNGSPKVAQFEAFLRRTLLAVPDVTGIVSLDTLVAANRLSYRVEIQTIYGTGTING